MDSSGISALMLEKSSLPFCVLRIEHGADGQPTGWKILRCNQALSDMTGFSAEQMQNDLAPELMPMSGVRRLRLYSRAAHDKQPVEFDAVSEVTGRLLHVHCLPMEQPDLCACIFCDRSTGQPHSRLEVIPTEKLSSVVQTGTWTVRYDRNGNRTSVTWSESFRCILGFSSEADFPNIWEAWFERIHPNDRDAVEKVCADAVSDRSGQRDYSIEYRMRNRTGEYHWFRGVVHISRRPDGTPACLDGILVNVDDRHEANEKLRRALRETEAARNEALIDNEIISAISRLYFSIYRIDLARDFYEEISSDSSVHRLTGHEGRAQQKMNKLCSGLVDRDYQSAVKRFFDLSTVAERLADTDTIEMEYLAKDGSWQEARFIEKKRGADGKVTHILYVTRIVSRQKQKELEQERLRIAYQAAESANEAKTDFLLSMSHDIRTPMNAILGYTQLMRDKLTDPELLHYRDMIEQSGELLLSIINNVLDMARIESGKMELDEDCHETGRVIGAVIKVFEAEAKKKGLKFERTVNVKHRFIMCDTLKVQEIFTNLISNAVKYTPVGGTVRITTEELPCDRTDCVRICSTVSDTGIGMSAEFLPHLFEPFSRERSTTASKIDGTGLGMPIVKKLIDLMGGTIEVKSSPGKGSSFAVTLTHRLAKSENYRKTLPASVGSMDFTGKRILLAEDNDLNAEIAEAILTPMGFQVDRVGDGICCVDRLEEEPSGTYDLILMDIQMPGMDGYKATRLIRGLPDRAKAETPIIAMTANAFAEDRRKALDTGMNDHIAKPVSAEKLRETLTEVLGDKERSAH